MTLKCKANLYDESEDFAISNKVWKFATELMCLVKLTSPFQVAGGSKCIIHGICNDFANTAASIARLP